VDWAEVSIVFFVCHLVGDFFVQTDWQATHKHGGLGRDPVKRRALLSHTATYTLCFTPALIWIGDEQSAACAIAVGAVIALPHMVTDDARLLSAYLRRVKGVPDPAPPGLQMATDQSIHLVCLWATALLATA
jgi:hypothetical protein